MSKSNFDIRNAIREAGFYYWQIATKYGVNDGNFSRLLRKDLTIDQKKKIFNIVEDLKKDRNRAGK